MKTLFVPYHLDEYRSDLDVPLPPEITVTAKLADGDVWQRLALLYGRVADTVERVVRDGERPVVMSGDCTTSLGTVAGLQRAGSAPSVVWFDAHGDVQTVETSTSGYLGGMPLRILLGYRPELIATELGLRAVQEHDVLLADGRDLDPPEVEYLRRSEIGRSTIDAIEAQRLPGGPIYLHVDLDVADPAHLPGLLYPTPDGPSLDTVGRAMRAVLDTGRVAAVGVACTWRSGVGAAPHAEPMLREALS